MEFYKILLIVATHHPISPVFPKLISFEIDN